MSMGYNQGPHQAQFQNPQALTPWTSQVPQVPVPVPAQPPTPEGTALAGTIGAVAAGLAYKGGSWLMNVSPSTMMADVLITGTAMATGALVSSLGYRLHANRSYQAAQYAMGMSGVQPGQAAQALRLSGRFGRSGRIDVNIPPQFIEQVADAWNSVANPNPHPNTPDVVNKYFEMSADSNKESKGKEFVEKMSPPNSPPTPQPQYSPQYPPQYAFVAQPQQGYPPA